MNNTNVKTGIEPRAENTFERMVRLEREREAKLEADARALWAVRVLDAWQVRYPDNHAFATYIAAHGDWRCGSHSYYQSGNGKTPDAARIAAAEALVAEDPTLGEGL
jgi:hypothetical protein